MPSTPPPVTRRRVLVGGAGVAGACLLAACTEQRPTPQGEATALGSLEPGTRVVALADVPVGGAVSATLDGHDVLVTQPAEGLVHLFSAICTHAGCTVQPADGELDCPCHGSRFALTDAAVLGGPAPEPLPEIPVQVSGDDVVLA
ncbi:QcrA and Rieske domain-containing protein [Puerhibacterium puerhi]|uniref:QcrA and Rieske domain-containing protein n=1 Tax=Puerhibacterium puerhi TaxID=2692623 RepID=UPI00135C5E23|nr:Rieske (2Fe-2S) protein [Puerhibacterium puerhi]